jgi:hypothetical protein
MADFREWVSERTVSRRTATIACGALLIAAALLLMRPLGDGGVPLRDFEAYYAAGAAWNAREDPYSAKILTIQNHIPGVNPARNELLPFVGMPVTLPLWGFLAHFDYLTASILWCVVLSLAFFAIIAAVVALTGIPLRDARAAAAFFFTLAFVPITSGMSLGQAALPGCAAMLLGVLALSRNAIASSFGFLLGALQPNVALPGIVAAGQRRGASALALAALICYAVGAFAQGPFWILRYSHVIAEQGAAERFAAIQYTPVAVLYGLHAPTALAIGLGTVLAAIAFGIAVYGALTARSVASKLAVACCAIPFVTGFVHEQDFVVMLLPALLAARNARGRWVPIVVVGGVLVAVNWLDFTQQPKGAWQDVVLACGGALCIAAFTLEPSREAFVAAAFVGAVVIAGAWIGVHHPLPIWPNDMAAVHPLPGADAATIWHEEQRQTGLLAPHTASALLRSLSLAGCGLLFAASIRYRRS